MYRAIGITVSHRKAWDPLVGRMVLESVHKYMWVNILTAEDAYYGIAPVPSAYNLAITAQPVDRCEATDSTHQCQLPTQLCHGDHLCDCGASWRYCRDGSLHVLAIGKYVSLNDSIPGDDRRAFQHFLDGLNALWDLVKTLDSSEEHTRD